jgi:hypothetical protein
MADERKNVKRRKRENRTDIRFISINNNPIEIDLNQL